MRLLSRLALFAIAALMASNASAQLNQSGNLGSGDLRRDTGEFYDPYSFSASLNQRVTVDMRSTAFDTYLIVTSPSGKEFINDDFDGTERSFLDLIAPESGLYSVRASAYSSDGSGGYSLEIQMLGIGRSVVSIDGRLDPTDPVAPKGEYYDTHTVQLSPGTEYFIELTTDGFDGYLSVRSPSGVYSRNDDAGDTTISRVGPLNGEFGSWTIYATSLSEEVTGSYSLRAWAFDGSRGGGFTPPSGGVQPPRPPRPVGGPLPR